MEQQNNTYIKIDDNTYETYDPETKMKVILSFSPTGDDAKIDKIFTEVLSKVYLRKYV